MAQTSTKGGKVSLFKRTISANTIVIGMEHASPYWVTIVVKGDRWVLAFHQNMEDVALTFPVSAKIAMKSVATNLPVEILTGRSALPKTGRSVLTKMVSYSIFCVFVQL